MSWWARAGSHLTSLQRLRAVAKRFPGNAGHDGLERFASMASQAGDRRWAGYARAPVPSGVRQDKGPDELALIDASALWPRLRAGFGVGAKADALCFLLGLRGAWASAKLISFATGYTSVAARKVAGEMALARLVRQTEGRPVEYLAPADPWAELLELRDVPALGEPMADLPPWRFWSDLFAFLVAVSEWSAQAQGGGSHRAHVLASRARDIVERHRLAFDLNGISTPAMGAYRGLDAAAGLHETVRAVTEWIGRNL